MECQVAEKAVETECQVVEKTMETESQVLDKAVEKECQFMGKTVENERPLMKKSLNYCKDSESIEAIRESSSPVRETEKIEALTSEVINLKVN